MGEASAPAHAPYLHPYRQSSDFLTYMEIGNAGFAGAKTC